jgi:hypothetical protein
MATSPVLAFIDSRTNQAQPEAKIRRRNNDKKAKRPHSARRAVRRKTTIGSYIYAIIGMVLYVISAKAGTGGCTLI